MILASKRLAGSADEFVWKADRDRTVQQVIIANDGASAVDVEFWFIPADSDLASMDDDWKVGPTIEIPANTSEVLLPSAVQFSKYEMIYANPTSANVTVTVLGR